MWSLLFFAMVMYRLKTMISLFNSLVKSVLLYGCQCWTLTKELERKLGVFQQKCLRQILQVFYPNVVSNREVLERTGETDIVIEVADRKWRWIGHMERKEEGNITREAFRWSLDETRRGWPRETWMRVVERESYEVFGKTFAQVLDSRFGWRPQRLEENCRRRSGQQEAPHNVSK